MAPKTPIRPKGPLSGEVLLFPRSVRRGVGPDRPQKALIGIEKAPISLERAR